MFGTVFSTNRFVGGSLAGAAATISSAIAYATGMEDAHINVTEDAGMFFLEGTAPFALIGRATEIATSLAGARVCNIIRAA